MTLPTEIALESRRKLSVSANHVDRKTHGVMESYKTKPESPTERDGATTELDTTQDSAPPDSSSSDEFGKQQISRAHGEMTGVLEAREGETKGQEENLKPQNPCAQDAKLVREHTMVDDPTLRLPNKKNAATKMRQIASKIERRRG